MDADNMTVDTVNLIDKLEAYRKAHRIGKNEMGRILGCTYRDQYTHWVKRGSLPKAYIDVAMRVLGNTGDFTKKQIELLKRIEKLGERDQMIVSQMIDTLLADRPDK